MITPDYLLTPVQLDFLWHDLGLGRLPYPLDVPSVGGTEEERTRRRHDVLDGLQHNGELHDLLRLLAEHEVSVDAVASIDRPVRAIAASDGSRAVLAVIDSDQVGLLEIRPTALARSIVEVLPSGTAGQGNALSMRLDSLRQAVDLHEDPPESDDPWGDDDLDERQALQRVGLSAKDAAQISELAANRVAGGQFGVTRGTSQFTSDRAGVTINWFDTPQGRYLMVHEDGWLSLSPTDNDRIANRIDSLLAAG
ncbi:ESX secretion-associated protein EspG [Lentzea tibetensis]|uniref:ESX secretion-associated protein EspG n=1 Tax=Lentzea tibetensis TaxID=2591470 RepID=A0A563EY14_9PSEU|nr:ESX secretion-associated protein EspG [Lentzea tibetensis]TWP52523.1 ESX secretion-associated protein EspG [Lentzea tibetensis]